MCIQKHFFLFNSVVFIWLHLLSEENAAVGNFYFTLKTKQLVNDANEGGVHCFLAKLTGLTRLPRIDDGG